MAAEHTGPEGVREVPVIAGLPFRDAPALSFPEVVVDHRDRDAYNGFPA
jgi:hypothetical protein